MIFWSDHQRRSYAEALGFAQWLCTHEDGRRVYVIAQDQIAAASEAGWQPRDCATVQKVVNPGAWRIDVPPPPVLEAAHWRGRNPGVAVPLTHRRQQGPTHGERSQRRVPTKARDELFDSVKPFAIRCAREHWKLSRRAVELEDLIQEAHIAALRAAESYDAAQGPFSGICEASIRDALLEYVRHHRDTAQRIARISFDASLISNLHVICGVPDADERPCNLPAEVVEALDALRSRQRVVLWEHSAGMTFAEAAPLVGVSRTGAAQLFERAIGRVQKAVTRSAARARHDATIKALAQKHHDRAASSGRKALGPDSPKPASWKELKLAILRAGSMHRHAERRCAQKWREEAAARGRRTAEASRGSVEDLTEPELNRATA